MRPTKDHGSIGNNVKVHFAGSEIYEFAYILHDSGVNYFLFTVLPFIVNEFGIKAGRISCCKDILPYVELPKISKHVIMDSGLFSLMFGAYKHIKPDEKFIRQWNEAICNFVNTNHIDTSIACVECDCQKLLGTRLAWELREKMRHKIPNPIINVFHFEDGKKGLDRLIDFSDYIAVSVPELRIVKPKTYKEDTYRIASYIKDKKPQIDLHLLGCTEKAILERCKFATSADSTSWQQVNRYGRICGFHTSQIKHESIQSYRERVKQLLIELGIEPLEQRLTYETNFWIAGYILKKEYAKIAGDQD